MFKKQLIELLLQWPSVIIRDQDLATQLRLNDLTRYGLVNRALKDRMLARLKRGVYCILPPYQKYLPNMFEIAQVLYGPSYISFESALSHHGLIPEAVYTTVSACIKRSQLIKNCLSAFRYWRVPSPAFTLGVVRIQEAHSSYLLATPWKAVADLCYIQKKEWKNLSDLCEDLRIDSEDLVKQDPKILKQLANEYGSQRVRQILKRFDS